ncbi:MAG TPA: RidA family protein [Dehalococcoidia bacterium]|nr:RidA family protein [Dehalococcoidia bacterium]
MQREIINLADGLNLPFSSAVKAGGFIFVSGQVGHIDAEGKPVAGIESQTRQCLQKMIRVLDQAGAGTRDVVKVTVYLRNEEDFAGMNRVYAGYFPQEAPARSTAIAGLALPPMLVEMDCIAYKPL